MMYHCNKKFFFSLLVIVVDGFVAMSVLAQSGPSDLLDLTIEELFEAEIYENDHTPTQRDRWQLAYRYQQSRFEDYMDGSNTLSVADVLFTPGQDQRSVDNFPVVPVVITQEVHAFILGYEWSQGTTLNAVIPFVYQETDHVSVVPNYADFTIRSSGIGDIFFSATQLLSQRGSRGWSASMGLSIPTGSIDERGDTPRAPGNQQLPYSMQIGSGTYDVALSLLQSHQLQHVDLGIELVAKLRTGRNDRDYRLGNRYSMLSWMKLKSFDWVEPSIKVEYKYWQSINGIDSSIQVPGAFVFPAPVTNPDLYGGRQIDVVLALSFAVPGSEQTVALELGRPVYQSLNGPQSAEEYQLGLSLNLDF